MIALISPAKTLDFDSDLQLGKLTEPKFLSQAENVMVALRKKSAKQLQKLQGISANLAALNYERNQNWNARDILNGRQAALAFKGDVYLGLEAHKWLEADMDFARNHLLILSGLYGLLKPSDAILPYRLEMGTKLSVSRKGDLYRYWKKDLKEHFEKELGEEEVILNLASNEYFKAIASAGIKNPIIDVSFKDLNKGKYKVLSFFAKKARGRMANFIVQNRINSTEELKDFNLDNYYFEPKSSSPGHLVFLRDKQ